MRPRWRKVAADLLGRPSRTLLTVVSLTVGVAAVGAMQLAGESIEESFDATYLTANPPSAVLGVDPFAPELVDAVRAHPDVADAAGRRRLPARAVASDGSWVNLELVSLAPGAGDRIARVEPRDGSWPPGDGAVVVERASLGALGVDPGDTLTVDLPGRAPAVLDVVGTAHDPYEIAPSLGGPARGYVDPATMAELAGSALLDTLYVRAADDPLERASALAVTAALRDQVIEPAGHVVRSSEVRDPAEHRARDGVMFMVPTLQLMSLLALAIAAVLVVNTVTALLAEQRRQIGVMKAIGATSRQLTGLYLGYVLLPAVAALVVAVPVSLLGARWLAGWTANLANFELVPSGVPWATLGIEAAVALVVPFLAVVVVVRRECRRPVRESVVDRGLPVTGRGGRLRLPLRRPARLALRNAVRRPARLALTVATVALTGAVLVGVLSTNRSLAQVTDEVAGYWAYDVGLSLTEPLPLADVEPVVAADPAVARVEGWLRTQAFRVRPDGSENENVTVVGVPPDSAAMAPTLTAGRWLRPGDRGEVVLNSNVAEEERDLDVGDQVVLDVEGDRRPWRVVGISTTTLVGPVAYVPVADLAARVDRAGEADLVALLLQPGADQQQSAERIEQAARAAGIGVGAVETNESRRAYVAGQFGLVVGFLVGVAVVLAVVAVVGVAGTMTLGVAEQTREIGVLRTLGASSRAVQRLLLWQGLAVAVLGWLAGAVLAVPAGALLQLVIGESLLLTPLPAAFSWAAVGLWLVVALAIGAVAATRPARVAARLTVRDTLAYE